VTTPADISLPRVLLLTGGSRGIGAAIAQQAVDAGYAVCFTYSSDQVQADATAASLRAQGGSAVAVLADAADPDATARAFDAAEDQLGPVTAVVHNAGITGRIGPFAGADVDQMRRVLDVNVLGAFLVGQQAVRRWQERSAAGALVNVTSIAATTGAPHEYVAYAASKAAVEAFTIGLGKEVAAQSIRVNAVSPGTVDTEIHAAAGEPERPARVVSRVPMGRIGQPHEIARAVLWLLSDEASYVTASVLRVSGGV